MSFREKTAWVCLVTMAAVYGWYFAATLPALAAGGAAGLRLSTSILVLAVLQVVPLVVIAAASPREAKAPLDERDRLIELKGSRAAYVVLVCGALLACVAAMHFSAGGALLANYIFLAIVAAQLAKYLTQIVHYRRGV
jgi:hypothetical protein